MTVVAMTEHTGPGAENLTGVWQGLYSYPHGQSVSFVATLIDSGASFSGTVHEPCILGNSPNKTLYAAVHYNGALNDDGTEIEGRWRIQGVWSGKFLMIRSAGKVAEVERKVSERI
jgi:hypothetical protein